LNYLAILLSAFIYFLLGGLWYALAFTKPWMAALNFGPALKKKAEGDFPKALGAHFVSGLLTSFVLANLAKVIGIGSFVDGLELGFWAWLGFALTINGNGVMFEKRPRAVFLINTGFFLVAFVLVGGIVTVWR
jgi:hypothetical protein